MAKGGGFRHHICWQKRKWSVGPLSKLRVYPYCVCRLDDEDLHNYIHNNMGGVKPPRQINADYVLFKIKFLEGKGTIDRNDPLEFRLIILSMLFEEYEPETADDFRKQLELVREYKNKLP